MSDVLMFGLQTAVEQLPRVVVLAASNLLLPYRLVAEGKLVFQIFLNPTSPPSLEFFSILELLDI